MIYVSVKLGDEKWDTKVNLIIFQSTLKWIFIEY